MTNRVVHFEVVGPDGTALKQFYAGVFGWQIDSGNPMDYGIVDTGVEVAIGGGISGVPDGESPHAIFYIGVDDPQATLVVVGGPSGAGGEAELARVHRLVDELDVNEQVRFVPPQPHAGLAEFYRAADVCLVPSRTESFGLVALEAAACGTPVVAGAVGGLRSLVDDQQTGYLVEGRAPADFAAPVARLLADPVLAATIGANAVARSRRYSWSMAAARLRRLYGDLTARALIRCD